MAHLMVPEITGSEDVLSFSRGTDDHSFNVVIGHGDTAVRLYHASADGVVFPHVGIVADTMTVELRNVVVSQVVMSGDHNAPHYALTFDASEVEVH